MMRTLFAIALFSVPTLALAAERTVTVDTLLDPLPTGTTGTLCASASVQDCSLRQAVRLSNEDTANHYIIKLPAGTYNLSRGLISVSPRPLTIEGDASGGTILDGAVTGQKIFSFDGTSGQQTVIVRDLTFKNARGGGTHAGLGGAIYVESLAFALSFERCVFSANSADRGGALYKDGGDVDFFDSTFDANTATLGGALYYSKVGLGASDIQRSTFSHNQASDSGGAIYSNVRSRVRVSGSTFSANNATKSGGAIVLVNPSTDSAAGVELAQTTLSGNSANVSGGAIFVSSPTNIFLVANSIFAANHAPTGPDCNGGTISTLGSNVFADLSGCTMSGLKSSDQIAAIPLGPLQNNGGVTKTHALGCKANPAIDTACVEGDAFSLTKCLGVDQRNFARPTTRTQRDKGAIEMLNTDYAVTLTGPSAAVPANTNFAYTAVVTNNGPALVPSGATLTVTLASGVLPPTGTSLPSGCTRAGQVITCALPQIAVGAMDTKSFTLRASKAGALSSVATVDSRACGENAANNSASHTLQSLARLTVADVQTNEGNTSGERTASFTVTVTPPSNQAITVTTETAANGTVGNVGVANPGQDYQTLTPTQKTIPAASSTFVISVPIVGDTTIEPNETFQLKLSSPSGADFGDSVAIATIINDDDAPPPPPPAITLAGAQDGEGDSGTTDLVFTLTRPNGYMEDLTYSLTASGGTATNGSDYTAPTQIVFPAADLTLQLRIAVTGDTLLETDETFTVNVTGNGSNVSALGTILNDETSPELAITGLRVAEGASGEIAASFLVTLAEAQPSQLDLNVSFVDGSATAGDDFRVTAPSVLSFSPGQTFAQVEVAIIGDLIIESDEEDFALRLTDALGTATQARAVIVDDDSPIDPVLDPGTDPAPTGPTGATDPLPGNANDEPTSEPTIAIDTPADTPAAPDTVPPLAVRPVDPTTPPAVSVSPGTNSANATPNARGCSAASGDDTSFGAMALLLLAILRRRRAKVHNARS